MNGKFPLMQEANTKLSKNSGPYHRGNARKKPNSIHDGLTVNRTPTVFRNSRSLAEATLCFGLGKTVFPAADASPCDTERCSQNGDPLAEKQPSKCLLVRRRSVAAFISALLDTDRLRSVERSTTCHQGGRGKSGLRNLRGQCGACPR